MQPPLTRDAIMVGRAKALFCIGETGEAFGDKESGLVNGRFFRSPKASVARGAQRVAGAEVKRLEPFLHHAKKYTS